jgi:predicted DNA binding protein
VISAQFGIRLPEGLWVAELSNQFPNTTFRLLSGQQVGDEAIELGEVLTNSPEEVVPPMREHPSISDYQLLEQSSQRALAKYRTTDTDLYEFVESASLTVEFPISVRSGWYEFDLTGTREDLDHLRGILEDLGVPYELRSLVSSEETDQLLTERQREFLEAAVHRGYFEVPRECTLEDVAGDVDVDKSTASTVLRRGQSRIVKWFITGPEGGPGPG